MKERESVRAKIRIARAGIHGKNIVSGVKRGRSGGDRRVGVGNEPKEVEMWWSCIHLFRKKK